MRFLIDNNLSSVVASLLNEAGHDAIHVREHQLQAATDAVVLEKARTENRVLISADTDFGALLAHQRASGPSLILIRRLVKRRAFEQAAIILANMNAVVEDLKSGAVVVLADDWLRVRRLPFM